MLTRVFLENNITGEALLECDQAVLKELGITKVGDRIRICVAVKALRTKASGNVKKRNRVCSGWITLFTELLAEALTGYACCSR